MMGNRLVLCRKAQQLSAHQGLSIQARLLQRGREAIDSPLAEKAGRRELDRPMKPCVWVRFLIRDRVCGTETALLNCSTNNTEIQELFVASKR